MVGYLIRAAGWHNSGALHNFWHICLLNSCTHGEISELHALSLEPPFSIENPQSFNLVVNLTFLPTTNMDAALSVDIKLKAFLPDPRSNFECYLWLMCLVKIIWIVLRRSESRPDLSYSFIWARLKLPNQPPKPRWTPGWLQQSDTLIRFLAKKTRSLSPTHTQFRDSLWHWLNIPPEGASWGLSGRYLVDTLFLFVPLEAGSCC